ncbi:MAG: CotH kinase family protein [Sedimentisphaerales bacterium]|nr:CotH kinase family protein [Sedimentisphaerales bacterium]
MGNRVKKVCFLLVTVLFLGQVAAQTDITSPGDTVRGVPNDSDWPSNEAPPLAIDDDVMTKYLHFKGDFNPDVGPTGLRITTSGANIVTGLTFTTANDVPGRDPIAFELSGSNESIDGPYTFIAGGDIMDFMQNTPWPRFTKNTTPIIFENTTEYVHYQLLFTAIRGPAGGSVNSMQIAEIELLKSQVGGLPPEVDAGDDRTVTWKGAGNTVISLSPAVYDDDASNISQTNPDYLTILWSSLTQPAVDFMGTETKSDAQVLFPAPGIYELQLQVWDESGQEGKDFITITVLESVCPLSDLTGDCIVDFSDLVVFTEQWLSPPGCPDYPLGCADLTGNDGVDLFDFALLAESWQEDWTGTLRIIISPSQAIADGAQWRLDGGTWQDSGDSLKKLIPGIHTLEFNIIDSWIRPSIKSVQVNKNRIITDVGTYVQLPESALIISEIMANNESTYPTNIEGKQVISDWIEIHNTGRDSINLKGWCLTDENIILNKWPLPDVSVGPDSCFVVYASGIEDTEQPDNFPYRDDYGRYHTNFKLDGKGEYLALVNPNGRIAHQITEYMYDRNKYGYPPQQNDISYGLYANERQFFTNPTPDSANTQGYSGISESPRFSRLGGTFTNAFSLELSCPAVDARIRYTLDGSDPTEKSRLYSSPISISDTVDVRACVFETGKTPSPVVGRTYVALDNDVQDFSSNLPIVIIDTNRRNIAYGVYKRVFSVFIDTGEDGRAYITDPADFAGFGGLKTRGRSTASSPKHSYGFEVWDENDRDMDVSIFGLPADSDWILYAPYYFDRALINNAFMFELSNRIGRYAVRTRFVEVYLNTDGGRVSSDDYFGIYIFMEKIKRGEERVNVEKLEPWHTTEPMISGGYMLKIDRPDSGDRGFRTSRGNPTYGDGTLCYVDPKEVEITTAQSAWIRAYLDDFEAALYGANFTDPWIGYARYIDVDSFVDHNLLNLLAMNVDALRLSTHLHKTRNGKFEMGPLWDFDRALDSADGRDNNPESWHGTGDGTDYLNYIWWDRLFDDPDFWQKYADRWFELRKGHFSTENINALIDSMADELDEAQVRNFNKWHDVRPRFGSFLGDIEHLKDWLERRTAWIDDQLGSP